MPSETTQPSQTLAIPQALLDAIDAGLTIYDTQFRLVAWNSAYERMGIVPPESIRHGMPISETYEHAARLGVFGNGDPVTIAAERLAMVESGESPETEDLRAANGRVIEIRRYFIAGIGVAAVFTDVTEARHAAERAIRSENLATLGRVAGGMAHDFNNLLTVIMGSLEIERQEAGAQRDRLEIALTAAERGAALCRSALAISVAQPEEEVALDVAVCIRESVRFVERVLPESIHVEVALHGVEDCQILADTTRFSTALLNLSLNAKDAMPKGGTLSIVVEALSAEPAVAIRVSDTGIGMDATTLARIDEPFFSTKVHEGGSGLGLPEVLRFVSDAGGRISFESEPMKGTRVEMILPRVARPRVEAEVAPEPLRLSGRALLVEDEPAVRHVVSRMLDDLDLEVVSVAGAEEARSALEAGAFDLLLTDYLLGSGVDGSSLAAEALARDPGLGVVICSGYSSAALPEIPPEIAVLSKPFTRTALREAIERALEKGKKDPPA